MGDGVNLASRIESLGMPGCVLLSDKVKDEINNHPALKTVSMGIYNLKNISRPVEVLPSFILSS
jgi:class 3 adenylate cyclase